jgi:iron complex outermembrane receptor protein
MTHLRSGLLASGAGLALIAFAGQGHAATATADAAAQAAADNDSAIAPVIVTARRVAEDVQKIPVAVTVVNSAALTNRNIQNLSDLKSAVPGIQIGQNSDNPSGATITIRGQGQADDLITADPSVGVYYDGVYLPRANALQFILRDSDEVGQVEVLRGPQGTLFGRNTTGGAFNISSTAPRPDFGAYGKLDVGNFNLVDVTTGVNVPLGDEAGLRISFEHSQHDGYGRNSAGAGLESENFNFVHGRFSAKAGDSVTIDATVNYLSLKYGETIMKLHDFNAASLSNPATAQTAGAVIADVLVESGLAPIAANFPTGIGILNSYIGGNPYRTGGGEDSQPLTGHDFTGGFTVAYRFSDALTFKSITGVVQTDSRRFLDLDGTPFHLLPVGEFTTSTEWSEELQALVKAGPFDGVGGVYFSKENGEDNSHAGALGGLGVAPFEYDGVAQNNSTAVFGQANWHVTDRLTFTAGLRYTWDSKGLTSYNHSGGGFVEQFVVPTDVAGNSTAAGYTCLIALNLQNVAPGQCEAHFVNKYSALSWLASVNYQFTDDTLGYFKVSRGYRGGGENLRGGALTFTPFGPEFATQYEVGLKTTFWDGRARLNAAAYYTDYSNIQLSNILTITVNGNSISGTTILNAAAASLRGLELEGTLIPIRHLTLGASINLFHGNYSNYNYGGVDETNQPWGGPKYTVDLLGRYELPTSYGSVALQADYYMQGRYAGSYGDITKCQGGGAPPCKYDSSQVVYIGSRGLLNARVTVHLDAWKTDVSLWAKNLTNEQYITGLLGGLSSQVFNTAYVGDPRTFGVEFRKSF